MISLTEPDNYDFTGTRAIATYDDTLPDDGSSSCIQDEGKTSSEKKDEEAIVSLRPVETFTPIRGMAPVRREVLEAVFRRALWYSLALAFIVTVLGTIYLPSGWKALLTKRYDSSHSHVFLSLRLQRRILQVLDCMYHVRCLLDLTICSALKAF